MGFLYCYLMGMAFCLAGIFGGVKWREWFVDEPVPATVTAIVAICLWPILMAVLAAVIDEREG